MATNRVLVLIDIQNEYFPGGGLELVGPEEAARAARHALEAARACGVPVVHVRHENPGAQASRFSAGSRGAAIREAVAPIAGEAVVTKRAVDSFAGTGLDAILRDAGIAGGADCEIAVAGMMTHMCVDAFLRAANARGYPCALLADATATRELEWNGRLVAAADVKAALCSAFAFFGVRMTDSAAWAAALHGAPLTFLA